MNKAKSKLYRKVNTKTYNVHHNFGGDFNDSKNTRQETIQQSRALCPVKNRED